MPDASLVIGIVGLTIASFSFIGTTALGVFTAVRDARPRIRVDLKHGAIMPAHHSAKPVECLALSATNVRPMPVKLAMPSFEMPDGQFMFPRFDAMDTPVASVRIGYGDTHEVYVPVQTIIEAWREHGGSGGLMTVKGGFNTNHDRRFESGSLSVPVE